MSTAVTGLTRAPAGGPGPVHPPGAATAAAPLPRRRGRFTNLKIYAVLFGLMAPSLLSLAVFTYYPQFGAIRYSFYDWRGGNDLEWVGLKNYVTAFTADPMFWQSFRLVLILLAANVVKMIPAILAAVLLHRLRSERWQYVYRVLFVVPMIIPAIVSLLIWKGFFDAGTGALNVVLNATGLMRVLAKSDHGLAHLAAAGPATWVRESFVAFGVSGLWWVAWGGAALILVRAVLTRLGVRGALPAALRWIAHSLVFGAAVAGLLTCTWPTRATGAFDFGTPAWLGNPTLLVPSLILWGFPWVGTVGVLIYLAGLQNITADVYEAAELDGVGSIRRLLAIELPLILTQVRINLIFLTIGTITDYGLYFVLLGPTGGPGGRGMVPGLYMYQQAFLGQRYGYACALGMVLFALLLAITVLYQKYVTVDK